VEECGDGFKTNLKPYKVSKSISNSKGNYLKQQSPQVSEGKMVSSNIEEEIQDARFMSNGLRLMILTNFAQIIVI
jgi:hypothetical protein